VEEVRAAEAAVPLAALGVEDPQVRPSPRRSVAASGDERLRPLADDVPTEPDPAPPRELQPEPGRFGNRARQAAGQPGWLDGHEEGLRPPGEGGQAPEPIGDLRRRRAGIRPDRHVHHEDVHRPRGLEHPGDRQAFVERLRRQDDEPVQADAASGGLDRIQGTGEVQPGDDRAVGLGLRDEAQGEGRRTGTRRPLEGDARAARQPTRPEDRVQVREAGPDDPLDASSRLARGRGSELGWVVGRLGRQRRGGQCPDHPRSCGTPPRLEGRQSRRHVRGEAGHRRAIIEHMFYLVKVDFPAPRPPEGRCPYRVGR
jgi:hypothetical protein